MVLMLHGTQTTKSTGSDPTPVITLNWGWQNLAEQKGFILVNPLPLTTRQPYQWNWNVIFHGCGVSCADVGTCTSHPQPVVLTMPASWEQLIGNLRRSTT